jgi:hypothetical protein
MERPRRPYRKRGLMWNSNKGSLQRGLNSKRGPSKPPPPLIPFLQKKLFCGIKVTNSIRNWVVDNNKLPVLVLFSYMNVQSSAYSGRNRYRGCVAKITLFLGAITFEKLKKSSLIFLPDTSRVTLKKQHLFYSQKANFFSRNYFLKKYTFWVTFCIACIRLYWIGPCQVQQRWGSRAQTQHEGRSWVFYF